MLVTKKFWFFMFLYHYLYLLLCSTEQRKSYRVETTWVWVKHDRLLFLSGLSFKVPAKSWPEVETPRGKTSLLKIPVCSFMTLNPEDRIPFMNLSCSQLWFEQYSQSISDLLHYWWPSLFSPMLFFLPPETSIQERSQPSPGKATLLRRLLGCLLGMLILSKLSLFDLSLLSPTHHLF